MYGPGRDRFRRTDEFKQNGVPVTKTTSYLGNVERIESSNRNTITWRRTVAGAVYTIDTSRSFQQQGETDKAFIYNDHLGSTDVITDKGGNVVQSMSFDAWGQRRDADSWDLVTDVIAQRFTERTSRGYTSHEQLDEVGLIHMTKWPGAILNTAPARWPEGRVSRMRRVTAESTTQDWPASSRPTRSSRHRGIPKAIIGTVTCGITRSMQPIRVGFP